MIIKQTNTLTIFQCSNGYGAIVVRDFLDKERFDVNVIKFDSPVSYDVIYNSPLSNDIVKLDWQGVKETMLKIEKIKPQVKETYIN